MKLKNILLALAGLLVIGGIGVLIATDIHVEQKPVTKTISNDRFFQK